MRILVTGGAGFIASHVADAYLAKGHEVMIIDNLSSGAMANVNPKATFQVADITEQKVVESIITKFKPEIINHHAAHIQVGNSVKNPIFDATANILGVIHIMESATKVGVKKVIMASTGGAMYGNQPVPFREEMPAEPLSPYGVSKRSGELYLHYYMQQYGISYNVLRYSNVYGPRQNPHGESGVVAIFSELITQGKHPIINGDGSHTRDYVYISDVVDANLKVLDFAENGIFNIGTGTEISTLQVFEAVTAGFGVSTERKFGPERPGEQVRSVLSSDKAKKDLAWSPTVSFVDGVTQVIAWYKSRTA